MMAMPRQAGDLTPAWFTQVLRAAGVLAEGCEVASLQTQAVGNGLVCESLRCTLQYSGPSAQAPGSVVCKLPASVPAYRAAGSSEMLYQREVCFYQSLAATVAVRSPRAYRADIEPASGDFVLVLEDMGPAQMGNQIAGCTVEQAGVVMDAAAALHAPRWGDATLARADWDVRERWVERIQSAYPGLFAQFCEVFASRQSEAELAIGHRFGPRIARWFAGQSAPWTLTHGDFRLDNMLFDIRGGQEPIAVLDWQTLLPGPGASDVAYFLGGCLSVADRRAHEQALLHRYHGALLARGVRNYPFAQLWGDYRYNAFMGYLVCTYASMLVPRTERGDTMFSHWLQRTAAQIADLDAVALLPH